MFSSNSIPQHPASFKVISEVPPSPEPDKPAFTLLGSSSAGNCGMLTTGQTRILVDAGFSGRKIRELLAGHGLDICDIDAVFLSHEHQDHCSGFRGLSPCGNLTWVANRETFRAIDHPRKQQCRWSFFETGSRFTFRDLVIDAFPIPHDASDPVGFVFHWGGSSLFDPADSLAWVLDLGHVTELVKSRIRPARTLVVEANYDPDLLEGDTKRPWSVKQRIRSRHGHLSNHHVYELLCDWPAASWEQIHIAHVSRDCNDLFHIRKALAPLRTTSGRSMVFHVFNPQSGRVEALWP